MEGGGDGEVKGGSEGRENYLLAFMHFKLSLLGQHLYVLLLFLLCSVRGGRHRTDNSRNILYFGPMLQVSEGVLA